MFLSTMFYLLGMVAMIQVVSSQAVLQSYQTFDSWGCYSDNSAARPLHHFVGSSPTMTTESCLAQCLIDDGVDSGPGGYLLGGLEFGTECYCGNAILNDHDSITSSLCDMPCAGNSSEICGGSNAIDIYFSGGDRYFFPGGLGEIAPGGYPAWQFYGCFIVPVTYSVTNRQIPNRQAIPTEEMSVEACLGTCLNQDFSVAGLQFGQECYCGNVTLPPGTAAPDSSCNMQCTQNATEFCGAANLNLVYTTIPLLPSGCELFCPLGVTQGGVFLFFHSSTNDSEIIQCNYAFEEPNLLVETCAYSMASGALTYDYDGPHDDCPSELYVDCQ